MVDSTFPREALPFPWSGSEGDEPAPIVVRSSRTGFHVSSPLCGETWPSGRVWGLRVRLRDLSLLSAPLPASSSTDACWAKRSGGRLGCSEGWLSLRFPICQEPGLAGQRGAHPSSFQQSFLTNRSCLPPTRAQRWKLWNLGLVSVWNSVRSDLHPDLFRYLLWQKISKFIVFSCLQWDRWFFVTFIA